MVSRARVHQTRGLQAADIKKRRLSPRGGAVVEAGGLVARTLQGQSVQGSCLAEMKGSPNLGYKLGCNGEEWTLGCGTLEIRCSRWHEGQGDCRGGASGWEDKREPGGPEPRGLGQAGASPKVEKAAAASPPRSPLRPRRGAGLDRLGSPRGH